MQVGFAPRSSPRSTKTVTAMGSTTVGTNLKPSLRMYTPTRTQPQLLGDKLKEGSTVAATNANNALREMHRVECGRV